MASKFSSNSLTAGCPGADGAPENTWLEHVTDADYRGPRTSTRGA